jgi:hypothetical protein
LKNPCNSCKNRQIYFDEAGIAHTCHGTCEQYAAYRKHREKISNARADAFRDNAAIINAMKRNKLQKNKIRRQNEL